MSIQTYILKLKNNTNMSYTALSKELGISYTNLIKLKDGVIPFPSEKVLAAFSTYKKRTPEEVLFDILSDDVDSSYDRNTLRHLCKLSCEGYVLKLNPEFYSPDFMANIVFEALVVKKRLGKRYTLVDSWNTVKRRFWVEKYHMEYHDDNFIDLHGITNEHEYVSEVINWSLKRVISLGDPTIKRYKILFVDNGKETWQQGNALGYAVVPKGLKLECILVEENK